MKHLEHEYDNKALQFLWISYEKYRQIGTQLFCRQEKLILEIVNSVFNSEMFEFHIRVLRSTVCFGSQLPGIHQ